MTNCNLFSVFKNLVEENRDSLESIAKCFLDKVRLLVETQASTLLICLAGIAES